MSFKRRPLALSLAVSIGVLCACGSSDHTGDSTPTAVGGSPPSGGRSATGTGGETGIGGANASGGMVGAGGNLGPGGTAASTGGAVGSGGAALSSGGAMSSGGQTSAGGASVTAGAPASGGTSVGGRVGGGGTGVGGTAGGVAGDTGGVTGTGGAMGGTGGVTGGAGGFATGGTGGSGGSELGAGGQPSEGGQGGIGAAGSSGGTGDNPRRVLLCDEGNRRVLLLDLENPGDAVWSTLLNDTNRFGDSVRDLQLVGDHRVAVSTARGYVELDIDTGEIMKEVSDFVGVESLRRLPSGNTVLGANADGGVTLQELDGQDTPVAGRQVTFTNHAQLRLLRRTPQDTFLLAVGAKLAEVNWEGETLWEMNVPDGDWVYQGLRLPDDTIAVTSGYGATVVVIDPATNAVLTTIGGMAQPDAATIVPNFYAGFQVLPNGHFVVTNWEGHGSGNGATGVQLLEYDPSGLLVWHWEQDPDLVSSLHYVIVLDGLDTTQLHDDIGGVLAPVAQ